MNVNRQLKKAIAIKVSQAHSNLPPCSKFVMVTPIHIKSKIPISSHSILPPSSSFSRIPKPSRVRESGSRLLYQNLSSSSSSSSSASPFRQRITPSGSMLTKFKGMSLGVGRIMHLKRAPKSVITS